MRRFQSGLWAIAVSWICSAFLHANDPGIGGVAGLWTPSSLASISVIAVFIAIPVLVCCAAFARRSWRGLLVTSTAFAVCMGGVLAFAGSGGDMPKSWLASFVGSFVLFWLVILVAASPSVWVIRSERDVENTLP